MSEKPVECLHTHVSQASAYDQYCEDLTNPHEAGRRKMTTSYFPSQI